MKRVNHGLALGFALCVAACGGNVRYLNRDSPEKGQTEFDRDQYECRRENQRPADTVDVETNNAHVAGIGLLAGVALTLANAADNAAGAAQCMSAQGWEKVVSKQSYDEGTPKAADQRSDLSQNIRNELYAAAQGNAQAQTHVGWLYEKGEGVSQNYAEALRWYHLAAAQGNANAQDNIGALYVNGQGVPRDYAEALHWLRLAAAQGYAQAQKNIGVLYRKGEGVAQDYAEAMRWFRVAAAQGNADAQTSIGWLYQHGEGVPLDYAEAARWYRKAADQGDKRAKANLVAIGDNPDTVIRQPQ